MSVFRGRPGRGARLLSGTGESGSVTPMVVAACALVIVLGGAGSLAVGAAGASSRARVAADLSAVAGAGALVAGFEQGSLGEGTRAACGAAAFVAARNGAALTACELDHAVNVTVEVTVIATPALSWPSGLGRAVARARAGPQPADDGDSRADPGAAVAGGETGRE